MNRSYTISELSPCWYDSNSCLAFVPFSEKFGVLKDNHDELAESKLSAEDYFLVQQTTKWRAHIGSGSGSLLNITRKKRDELIVNIFQNNLKLKNKALEKIEGRYKGQVLTLFGLEETLRRIPEGSALSIVCALYWFEKLMFEPKFVLVRGKYATLLAFCFGYLEHGFNLFKMNITNLLGQYVSKSKFQVYVTENQRPFSTNQLMESLCFINEAFPRVWMFDQDFYESRFRKLLNSPALDPISYAYGSEVFMKEIGQSNPHGDKNKLCSHLLTIQVALDIAIDIYFFPYGKFENLLDNDLFPPSRYERCIRAINQIGVLRAKEGIDIQQVEAYKRKVCQIAGIFRPTDWVKVNSKPYVQYRRYYESLIIDNEQSDTTDSLINTEDMLYDIIQFLQNEVFQIRVDHHISFGTDLLVSIMNPIETNGKSLNALIYDRYIPKSCKGIFRIPILLFENGRTGFQVNKEKFAHFLMRSSLKTYPLFDIAFNKKDITEGPVNYSLKEFGIDHKELLKQFFVMLLKTL